VNFMTTNWYVVQTRPYSESTVGFHLSGQGFNICAEISQMGAERNNKVHVIGYSQISLASTTKVRGHEWRS
jgi:hypothetical protein